MARAIDITGQRFGRVTVLKRAENRGSEVRWRCVCDCGESTEIASYPLRRGLIKSCGCLARELRSDKIKHGHARRNKHTRAHKAWLRMKARCQNPKDNRWHSHGGRGIQVCERWMDFVNFLVDMGEPPQGLSLERVDNDGNYCLDNCIWASRKTQQRNRRNTKYIVLNGRNLSVAEVCEKLEIPLTNINSYANNPKHRMTYAEALLANLMKKSGTNRETVLASLEEEFSS